MIQRIDAHQHFWRLTRGDYGWLRPDAPALKPLYRDFLPSDLHATMKRNGVLQTVLVQAAPTVGETDFLLELASAHEWIAGVVGWVDLGKLDAVDTLESWSRHPKFKGVRPMLQDLPESDWIAWAPHPEVMQALQRLRLRFDALVKPEHLDGLLRFVGDHGDLSVVIDHGAKPRLDAGWTADGATQWRRGMAALAAHPHVMCKLSGLLTEASNARDMTLSQAVDCVRPVWHHLLDCFGTERLMWGSDWPVLTLAADFERWIAVCTACIDELPSADRAGIWRGNALRFYGL